jgi:hypothetical protein
MDWENAVLSHYTDNGKTNIALIPQYAVLPGEQWSIDFLGIDLRTPSLLFIEVTEAQTPSAKFVDKLRRRDEWIPLVRQHLITQSPIIDATWKHLTVAFVIDTNVDWLRRKLQNPSDVVVEPLSSCCPKWLAKSEPRRGWPRVAP